MNIDNKPTWWWAVGFVLIFLTVQLVVQTGMLVVKMVETGSGTDVQPGSTDLLISMAIFSVATILLFSLTRWTLWSKTYIMSRQWSVLFWSSMAALGALLPSMCLQELLPKWPGALQDYARELEVQMGQVMSIRGSYFVICLLGPLAEEMVFRGAALRTLLLWQPRRRWLMIALSALLFALAHMNPEQLVHPFLIGLLLGWMYERTGSIVPGVVYHWVNNTAAYLLYHAYPSPDLTLTDIFGQPSRVALAVVFSLLIILPAIYQLNLRMKRS